MTHDRVQLARDLVPRLVSEGAAAVVLAGSHATGDVHPHSDVDLVVVGAVQEYRLERHGDALVSVLSRTLEQHRAHFFAPSEVGTFVPGWRDAHVLHDPQGVAARLVREASEWTWERIAAECDAWVAEEITVYSEVVHKLVGNVELGRRSAAAAQRSLLAVHLAAILAVHHRILYGAETKLWDAVAGRMGERWERAQRAAFGEGGESFEETCRAALELFALAAPDVGHLLDARQRAVVACACTVAQARAEP